MKPSPIRPIDGPVARVGIERAETATRDDVSSRLPGALGLRARLARAAAHEGAVRFACRKTAQGVDRLSDQARTIWLARRPWLPDGRPVFLFVNHRCGGGTEQHVRHLCEGLRAEGVRVVVVRPARDGFVVWEERDERQRVVWCRESSHQRPAILRLLELIRPVHAHVHHTLAVPGVIVELLADLRISYDWTIHDYYSICPRINLVNVEHSYCGEPDEPACNRCLAQFGDDQGRPVTTSIENWRAGFARHLARARRVFVPSLDVRDRLERYFPGVSLLLRPHPESLPNIESLAAVLAPGESVRVAVVGTITAIKGSERLLACARDALARRLPLEFHVIGSTDRDAIFSRLPIVHISGRYHEHEVYSRLAAARCHLAFLPSLWPESYMYTLSVVMASGLYTICFDLGAQSSRLESWGWGRVLPLNAGPEAVNDTFLVAAHQAAAGSPAPSPPPPTRYRDLLGSYYGFSAEERARLLERPAADDQAARAKPHFVQRKDHARFH